MYICIITQTHIHTHLYIYIYIYIYTIFSLGIFAAVCQHHYTRTCCVERTCVVLPQITLDRLVEQRQEREGGDGKTRVVGPFGHRYSVRLVAHQFVHGHVDSNYRPDILSARLESHEERLRPQLCR